MIRCSSLSKFVTNRPTIFSQQHHDDLLQVIIDKLAKKDIEYDSTEDYSRTRGIIGDVERLNKYISSCKDELPEGAKTELKKIWLRENRGFRSPDMDTFATRKGKAMEDDAIAILSEINGTSFIKNTERKIISFLSGECDVTYKKVVRDIKCPETWMSFRKAVVIPAYFWQLIGYAILWEAEELYLDYVLMPYEELLYNDEDYDCLVHNNEVIESMELSERVKSFKVPFTEEDIAFAQSRINMSEEYYKNLDYVSCLEV